MTEFKPECRPTLIGSLPVQDHLEAHRLVMDHTPEIPPWAQLPIFRQEGMVDQFLPGFPGVTIEGDRQYVDTESSAFDDELVAFYEAYLACAEDPAGLDDSIFALSDDTAAGFYPERKPAGGRCGTLRFERAGDRADNLCHRD